MAKKVIIIGGVAGGASAAARLRRLDESADIILLERSGQVSFANCGMPYYIGGVIEDRDELLLQTPQSLYARFRIDVRVHSEALEIHPEEKTVLIRDLLSGSTYTESYDSLVLSPGAAPVRPPLPGASLPQVFTLRNMEDCDAVKAFLLQKAPGSALVVGGGFIGLEMAENLSHIGVSVTLAELSDQVMAPLDADMAAYLHKHLISQGVKLLLGTGLECIRQENDCLVCQLSGNQTCTADMVILAVGVTPDSHLAAKAGLDLGARGGIMVDQHLCTSAPGVYAVGDAVLTEDFVLKEASLIPLAGPANRQGRIVADVIAGRDTVYQGTLGTSICRVFRLTAGSTGKNEKQLKKAGISYGKVYTHPSDHAGYYPAASIMHLKLLFCPESGHILGAQAVGTNGVDKRLDVLATAIYAGLTVEDLEMLELAYAPPFSAAKDPVNLAGFVASNVRRGDLEQIFPEDVDTLALEDNTFLVDVRTPKEFSSGTIPGAMNIPVDELRDRLGELPQDKHLLIFCRVGLRGYVACRILTQRGFHASNLSGGYLSWAATHT